MIHEFKYSIPLQVKPNVQVRKVVFHIIQNNGLVVCNFLKQGNF